MYRLGKNQAAAAAASRRTAQRLLPLLLSVMHGGDAVLSAAASAALATLGHACAPAAKSTAAETAPLPAVGGLQASEPPLKPLQAEAFAAAATADAADAPPAPRRALLCFLGEQYGAMLVAPPLEHGDEAAAANARVRHAVAAPGLALVRATRTYMHTYINAYIHTYINT